MRSQVLSGALAVLALGCSGGDGGTGPGVQTGTVAGSVRNGATGVANVSVGLTGGATRNATTAGTGAYAFGDLTAGAYTVAITVPAGLQLAAGETGSRPVTVTAGQTTTVNFSVVESDPATIIEAGASTFTPGDVTVAAGTRVRWTNSSGLPHTVTPSGHAEWAEAQLPNNGTFEHDFDTVGVFPYLCTIHAGMTGVVRVQ